MSANTKPSEINISELSIRVTQLDEANKAKDAHILELEQALKQANDVIEADIKAKLSTKILANSKYTIEDISRMSVDELKGVEKILVMSTTPFKGIRPGMGASDDSRVTVPDKFAFGSKMKEGE